MEHELAEEAPGWKTGAARTVERVFLMHWFAEAPPTAKMRLFVWRKISEGEESQTTKQSEQRETGRGGQHAAHAQAEREELRLEDCSRIEGGVLMTVQKVSTFLRRLEASIEDRPRTPRRHVHPRPQSGGFHSRCEG